MEAASQYDSLLGGSQDLPPSLNMLKFTAARYKEIQAMKKSLKTSSSVKLAFQKLPVHMRRRIMSHTVKRLPRRLREMHMNQLKKSGLPPKQKRPSRKHRRRPRNLMEEYERRRRRVKWLETHIWHAKRFHMVEKWGYKLADRPCDKAFRACYRATAKHCLMQDISFFCCVEIEGPQSVLIERLREVCEPCVGLSLVAKAFMKGTREGRTVLFDPRVKPKRAVGAVYFNWKALSHPEKNVLWLWLHPAFYSEALDVLTNILNATIIESENEIKNQLYINKELGIRVSELKLELNRFRLTGPLSQAILRDSLKIASHNVKSEWFMSYLNNNSNRQSFANQINYWQSLNGVTNPAELSPHIVVSLIVSDPRFNLPNKRTKAVNNDTATCKRDICSNEPDLSVTPLWDITIRQKIKESRISNAAIAELRSRLLVPGTELEEPGAPVPLLLIHRPGNTEECLGYGAGWDVIIPAAWGQAFWMAFIMRGARVGGLRESASIDFEMGRPDFLAPDTLAGKDEEKNAAEILKEAYFKRPPNKRTNFNKYSIVSPFNYNWSLLVSEWIGEKTEDVQVLRDKKLLNEIRQFLTKKVKPISVELNKNYIIPVQLKVQQKGCPRQFSIICLPNVGDIKQEPIETEKPDVNQLQRKQLRREHKKLLETLKRRRRRAKKNGKVCGAVFQDFLKSLVAFLFLEITCRY